MDLGDTTLSLIPQSEEQHIADFAVSGRDASSVRGRLSSIDRGVDFQSLAFFSVWS